MTRIGVWGSLLVLVATLSLTACASMSSEPAPSLYRRLGGREGIAGVVDAFVTNALADPRIGPAFKSLPAAKVGPLKSTACNAALAKALDSNGVKAADKEQLMKLVQSLMPDIVGQ